MYYGNNMYISLLEINQLSLDCEKKYNFLTNTFLNELTFYENYLLSEADNNSYTVWNVNGVGKDENKDKKSEENNSKAKTSFLDTIKKIIDTIIKFFINAFKKLEEFINKTVEKIKYNTIQDKFTKLILKDITYKNIEKAKENGWKGFTEEESSKLLYVKSNPLCDYTQTAISDILKKYKFSELLDKINNEFKEDIYEKYSLLLMKIKQEINKEIEVNNSVFHNTINRKFSSITANLEYDYAHREHPGDTDESFKKRMSDLYKKYPGDMYYPVEPGIPDLTSFNNLKDFLFNNKKIQNDSNKVKESLIKDANAILDEETKLIKNNSSSNASDNNYNRIIIARYKLNIMITNIKVSVYRGVTANYINLVQFGYRFAFETYFKIVMKVKQYNALKI